MMASQSFNQNGRMKILSVTNPVIGNNISLFSIQALSVIERSFQINIPREQYTLVIGFSDIVNAPLWQKIPTCVK